MNSTRQGIQEKPRSEPREALGASNLVLQNDTRKESVSVTSTVEKEEDARKTHAVHVRGQRRLLLALTSLGILACNVLSTQSPVQEVPQPTTSSSEPSPIVFPTSAFQVTATPMIFMPSVTPAQFFSPTPVPEVVFQPTESDPMFLDGNSVKLKDPGRLMDTPEQATALANALVERLRARGMTQDNKGPITVNFGTDTWVGICRANSAQRTITCQPPDGRIDVQVDASLLANEVGHILENDSPTFNIGELRGNITAYILSNYSPYSYNRYYYRTRFSVAGRQIEFTPRHFVEGMYANGITEDELLRYAVGSYTDTEAKIANAVRLWLSNTYASPDERQAVMNQLSKYTDHHLMDELTEKIFALNPWPGTMWDHIHDDPCRLNQYPTMEELFLGTVDACYVR